MIDLSAQPFQPIGIHMGYCSHKCIGSIICWFELTSIITITSGYLYCICILPQFLILSHVRLLCRVSVDTYTSLGSSTMSFHVMAYVMNSEFGFANFGVLTGLILGFAGGTLVSQSTLKTLIKN
jgi:hypothetical protein